MAKPVVDFIQSAPGAKQWNPYGFQPWATNDPTSWLCSPLPPGMSLNATTGLISGTPMLPGVYVFSVRATNADGTSDPVVFCIGVEKTSPLVPSSAVDTQIDLATRLVKFDGLATLWIKRGDNLIFQVQFLRGGVPADLDLITFKVAFKDLEENPALVLGTAFVKIGTGTDAVYRIHLYAASTALTAALADNEPSGDTAAELDKRLSKFPAIAEFEWVENNTSGVGPANLRSSSRCFVVQAVKDIIGD